METISLGRATVFHRLINHPQGIPSSNIRYYSTLELLASTVFDIIVNTRGFKMPICTVFDTHRGKETIFIIIVKNFTDEHFSRNFSNENS